MTKPRILTATFEESLNTEDLREVRFQRNDRACTRPVRHPILIKIPVLIAIAMTACVPYFLRVTETNTDYNKFAKIEINLLPVWLYWTLLGIYVLSWLITLVVRKKSEKYFWAFFNISTFSFFLYLVLILFFTTILLAYGNFWILIWPILVTVYYLWLKFKERIKELEEVLFGVKSIDKDFEDDDRNRLIFKIGSYSFVITAIYLVVVPFLAGNSSLISEPFSLLIIYGTLLVAIVFFGVMQLDYNLGILLNGYYRIKYSEQYRIWDGVSQKEWYGKRYFNRKIKGTALEETE